MCLLTNTYSSQIFDATFNDSYVDNARGRPTANKGRSIQQISCYYLSNNQIRSFSVDQIIFSQDQEDMKYMLKKLKNEYEKLGLNINVQKTELCVWLDKEQI